MNPVNLMRQKAFTLIEVMAAVAVFTISSVGLYTVNQQNVLLADRLENKTFANWLALNTFNRLDLSGLPGEGTQTDTKEFAGSQWKVSTTIQETPLVSVRKVTIKVNSESNQQFASVVGFIGSRVSMSTVGN